LLVANGHHLEDVLGYTVRRIQILVDFVFIRRKGDLASLAVAIRHSQGSDAKVWKEFIKSLESEE